MKKSLLGTFALGAVATTVVAMAIPAAAADLPSPAPVYTKAPPPAPLGISGYIDLYGGGDWWNWNNGAGYNGNDWIFGGNARINDWIMPSYAVQLDLDAEATSTSSTLQNFCPSGTTNSCGGRLNMDIAAHGAWRDPSVGAVGLFGVIAKSNDMTYYGGDMTEGLIGAEGQYYWGNVTLYGQVGFMGTLDNNIAYGYAMAPQDTWFVRGVGRYFFTPDDKLQGEVGFAQSGSVCLYSNCASYGSASPSYLTWGARYEHRFMGTPWSVFLDYAGFRVDGSSAYNGGATPVVSNNIMGGVKLSFGQPTLLAEDRQGATFDVPTFLRALNWTYFGGGLY